MHIKKILNLLDKHYPYTGKCFLDYNEPWQLLFATILSAQCTDDVVNRVTKKLFNDYKNLQDFADADINDLEQAVKQTGFYRAKAKNLKETAIILLEKYNGILPSDMDDLTSLKGVGRKTANIVRGHIFNIPGIAVDTHVKRVSFRLGLTTYTDPEKIEYDLMEKLPQKNWIPFNTQIISHGRAICTAKKAMCEICMFKKYCKESK